MFMKVDFPLPLAPMIATKLARLDLEAHAAQRVHARLAQLIVLVRRPGRG